MPEVHNAVAAGTAAAESRALPAAILAIARPVAGLAVILLCYEAGLFLAQAAHLPVPGSILGLVLLLALLATGLVPSELLDQPSGWLLFLLPVMFVPFYIGPFSDGGFWLRHGIPLAGGAIGGTTGALVVARLLAARMSRS